MSVLHTWHAMCLINRHQSATATKNLTQRQQLTRHLILHIATTSCFLIAVFSFSFGTTAISDWKCSGKNPSSLTGYVRRVTFQSALYAAGGLFLTIAFVFQILSCRSEGQGLLYSAPVISLCIGLSVYLTLSIFIPAYRIYQHITLLEEATSSDIADATVTAEQPALRGRTASIESQSIRICALERRGDRLAINANG